MPGARSVAILGALLAVLLPTAGSLGHPAPPDGTGVTEALGEMTVLTQRRLSPPAQRLARGLPGDANGLAELREPAGTVEAQLRVALDELQQMNALVSDSHYLPALVAVGRAFVAASGQDPLTRTTINPDYVGLERELAEDAARLDRAAGDAGELSRGVRRLTRMLVRTRRRARALGRRIQDIRARDSRIRGR
jgi:hypothetical protein